MSQRPSRRIAAIATVVLSIGWATAAGAQHHPAHSDSAESERSDHGAGPHRALSPVKVATRADSARALALVQEIRANLTKYRDPQVALAEGFRPFLPNAKAQNVWHYTNRWNAIKERFRFDPSQPTSLLYRSVGPDSLELIGAMYTMPRAATGEELDQRIPLGIARWHKHVNICLPPGGRRALDPGRGPQRFGPRGIIESEAACKEAGGRFLAEPLRWMVHVNAFAEDGLGAFH